MALIAALSAMAVFAAASGVARDRNVETPRVSMSLTVVLGMSALIAFLTMCVGAYVSSSGAGLACLTIPGCAGSVVVHTSGQFVQMLHRFAAAATLISAAGAFALAFAQPATSRVRIAVGTGVALVMVQVLLGLLNVTLRLPTELREAHAVNAALVFLALFVAAAFAMLDAVPAHPTRTLAKGEARR
jgi:heme A synthase